jgi:hypothetical protein
MTSVSPSEWKDMAARDQLGAQFRIVVDGAVEHQRGAAGGVEHRLLRARRQVDDRQPAVAQPHRPSACWPSASGPRRASFASMRAIAAASGALLSNRNSPAMPHMF